MQIIQKIFIKATSKLVGHDTFGNNYYQSKYYKNHLGQFRRYVIYKAGIDVSSPNPLWNSWLHHMISLEEMQSVKIHSWGKVYQENQTGTKQRYSPTTKVPDVSAAQGYEAWKP